MRNPYEKYQQNNILTATPEKLTLMLYDGAIKFANIAKKAMENKEIEKAHANIIKIENIIEELWSSLNYSYSVAKDFEIIYKNIFNLLVKSNVTKDPTDMEKILKELREIRNIWNEVITKK